MHTDELYTIMLKLNKINVHLVFKEIWKKRSKIVLHFTVK